LPGSGLPLRRAIALAVLSLVVLIFTVASMTIAHAPPSVRSLATSSLLRLIAVIALHGGSPVLTDGTIEPSCDDRTPRAGLMAAIWKRPISVELLNSIHVGTTVSHLGIEFLEVGDDFIRARAPVDARTRQPMGVLHGGISVLLAESLGSCGAAFSSPPGYGAVGLEINANHLRSVNDGWVVGVCRPFHTGRTTQVWHIEISNERGQLTCASRITIALLSPQQP